MSKPRLTGSHHLLPFERLSPVDFERLCYWLICREGYSNARHIGAAGQDLGIDLKATSGKGEVFFQCKRVKEFGPKEAEQAVREMLSENGAPPAKIVLLVACNVTNKAEKAAKAASGSVPVEVWALSEIDERVKRQPDILREFFNSAGSEQVASRPQGVILKSRTTQREDGALLDAYRRYIYDLYRLADIRGLFWRENVEPREAREEILLCEIFVETLLHRRYPRLVRTEEEDKERMTADDGEREKPSERGYTFRQVHESPRTVADVLAEERCLVILGPPGSGKSTLMRCLTLALATDYDSERLMNTGLPNKTVPILLLLKTWAANLKSQPSLRLDVFLKEQLGQQIPSLHEILVSGNALVLLDGFDEVFDDEHRRWVSDEIWRVMNLFRRAHFVLASRPHSYRAAALPGAVPLFEMVPFDDKRIGRFFCAWLTGLERQGYDRERDRTPKQQAADLTKDVLERPRLRSLAENPMLCTLILLVNRSYSGRLPQRRVNFYEAAITVLVEHWEKAKRSPKQEVEFPEPDIIIGILADVAWRAKTELKSREIPADILEAWMREALSDYPEWSGIRKRAARGLLKVIQGRTGLLIEAGENCYQFAHLSLHDYLAGFYTVGRLNDQQCCLILRHFLHAPGWEEVLRLAICVSPRARADRLILSILDKPTSEWEELTHRDLRFVCRALANRPNLSSNLWKSISRRWPGALGKAPCDIIELAADGASLGSIPEASDLMLVWLASGDTRRQECAIKYFTLAMVASKDVRSAMKDLLDESSINTLAVEYFITVRDRSSAVITAIETLLDDEMDRGVALDYFLKLEIQNERIALAQLEEEDQNEYLRQVSVAFGSWRRGLKAGMGLRSAKETIDSGILYHVRVAVEGIAESVKYDKARGMFKPYIESEKRGRRLAAAIFFRLTGDGDLQIRSAMRSLLFDPCSGVRAAAAEYYSAVGFDACDALAVLDAITSSSGVSFEAQRNICIKIGYLAAVEDSFLERVFREDVIPYQRCWMLGAAADRRDEIRRESTPLADVLSTAPIPRRG